MAVGPKVTRSDKLLMLCMANIEALEDAMVAVTGALAAEWDGRTVADFRDVMTAPQPAPESAFGPLAGYLEQARVVVREAMVERVEAQRRVIREVRHGAESASVN